MRLVLSRAGSGQQRGVTLHIALAGPVVRHLVRLRSSRLIGWPVGALLALAGPVSVVAAQSQVASCAHADSSRRRPSAHGPLLFFFSIPIAPSALLLLPECGDTLTLSGGAFAQRDVSLIISASAGLADDYAHTESVELHYHRLYLAFRSAHQDPSTPLAYRTGRIGVLSRGAGSLEGGASIGYRTAMAHTSRGGVELAFPLRVSSRRWSALFESSYVFAGRQAYWNYRLEADYPVRQGPLFLGWLVDANELPLRNRAQIRTVAVGMTLGVRR